MARLSPERRRGSQELLAVEFCTSDGGNVVGELSPCKPQAHTFRALRPGAALMAAFEGAAGSPCAVADMPAAPSTASQPSSATSSLAAALADLQVASRQSSENDLGDRSKILAALGLGGSAAGARLHHSRCSSGSCDEDLLLAVVPALGAAAAAAAVREEEERLCSPQLIGAVRSFDSQVLRTLSPIRTRTRAAGDGGSKGTAAGVAGAALPSPAAPYADSLASPFREGPHAGGGIKPRHLQSLGCNARPVIYHSRSSSITAPGAYNPYDLTAAALSSEFRSPAKSLHSPFPTSSRTASSTVTPSQWGSAGYRASAYRSMAAQQALAAQKDDEPDFYVSVPGVRRQQTLLRGNSSLSSLSSLGSATAAAAAAAAAAEVPAAGTPAPAASIAGRSPKQQQQQPVAASSSPAGGLERQPTLGSGTAVHGFKGLFRNIIVGGAAPNP